MPNGGGGGSGGMTQGMTTLLPFPTQSGPRDWFRFAENKADNTAEIYLYGDIGDTMFTEGVSAQSFCDELDAITAPKMNVRINSPGGSAYDGLTIANAIVRHPAHVTCWIDGLAASAASIVAMAGDDVVMSKYGEMMLHNAHAVVVGTSKDMREVASQLDTLNASIASFYADRSTSGDDAAAFARAMAKESWYNAGEALTAGLVTRIDDSAVREETRKAVAKAMSGTLETYRYRGRTAAPAPMATTRRFRCPIRNRLPKGWDCQPTHLTPTFWLNPRSARHHRRTEDRRHRFGRARSRRRASADTGAGSGEGG